MALKKSVGGSSRRKTKATGTKASDPKWGIKNTSRGNTKSLGARTARLFGTSKFSTPSNQGALKRKTIKGQVQ